MKTLIKPIKQNSAAANTRALAHEQQALICRYLGWTEVQYCNHQLKEYEDFLKRMFFGFPEIMLNEVRYSSQMAGYWKNEWVIRNIDFLEIAREALKPSMWVDPLGNLGFHEPTEFNKSVVYDEYLYTHSAKILTNDESFMIGYNRVLKLIIKSNK